MGEPAVELHGNRGDGLAQVMKGVRMGVRKIEGRFGGQSYWGNWKN